MTLTRPALAALRPYTPEPPGAPIDLSDNTNLFGVPPAAMASLSESGLDLRRYPAAYSPGLQQAIASYLGVPAECLVTGCGSDDVIDSTFRAFLEPGDWLACCDPTFSMAPVFASVQGARVQAVPFAQGFDADVEALLAVKPKLIYLCSPNNPTGTILPEATVRRVLERAPGLVLLDEAYAEFAGVSYAQEAPRHPNLIVTRTLSKAFGLAGLRVGYAVSRPEWVKEIAKARGPYKIHTLAERAATAAVTEDVAWMREQVAQARAVRDRFSEALGAFGLRALPSEANFLLVPVPDAAWAAARLGERGIRVRSFQGLSGIGDALRITCGPWPLMEQVLPVLKAMVTR